MLIATLFAVLAIPLLMLWLQPRSKFVDFVGPVLICYGLGLLLGNLPGLEWHEKLLKDDVNGVSVALAIPMMMFGSNPRKWFSLAGKTLLSFLLGAIAVGTAVTVAYITLGSTLQESQSMAAMMVGVYTGGTPNLIAIGKVLQVGDEVTPKLMIMDTVLCAFYLLFLLTIANKVLSTFLKPGATLSQSDKSIESNDQRLEWGSLLPLGLSLACLGLAIGLSLLIKGTMDELIILLTITISGFLLSFSKKVNQLKGSYQLGEVLIWIFCVSIGLLSNFSVMANESTDLIVFCAVIIGISIALHYLLAFFFKIDTHTVLITSTAALFGPAFVGLVASRLKNPGLVTSGMTTGVIGYSIANVYALLIFNMLGQFGP